MPKLWKGWLILYIWGQPAIVMRKNLQEFAVRSSFATQTGKRKTHASHFLQLYPSPPTAQCKCLCQDRVHLLIWTGFLCIVLDTWYSEVGLAWKILRFMFHAEELTPLRRKEMWPRCREGLQCSERTVNFLYKYCKRSSDWTGCAQRGTRYLISAHYVYMNICHRQYTVAPLLQWEGGAAGRRSL